MKINLMQFKEAGIEYCANGRELSFSKEDKNLVLPKLPAGFYYNIDLDSLEISILTETEQTKNFQKVFYRKIQGTYQALIKNAFIGFTNQHSKSLKMIGSGYRSSYNSIDRTLCLYIGYSHPVNIVVPQTISIVLKSNGTDIQISGISKEEVGFFAAKLKSLRKQNVYKKTGIFITGQYVRTKEIRKT